MLKTVFRISVMYLVAASLMRIAGKKEIAQLEVSELVTSFMISEIACMPITDPDVPLLDAIVFSVTVIVIEMLLSYFSIKIPQVKHFTTGKPDYLIVEGRVQKKALKQSKVSLSEIVSAMRAKGITSLKNVSYAIQEPDGNISIIQKRTANEGNNVLEHMLICDGTVNLTEAKEFGYTKEDVEKILSQKGYSDPRELFYLGIDDEGEIYIVEN